MPEALDAGLLLPHEHRATENVAHGQQTQPNLTTEPPILARELDGVVIDHQDKNPHTQPNEHGGCIMADTARHT